MNSKTTHEVEFSLRIEGVEVVRKVKVGRSVSPNRFLEIVRESQGPEDAVVTVVLEALSRPLIEEMVDELLTKISNPSN